MAQRRRLQHTAATRPTTTAPITMETTGNNTTERDHLVASLAL